MSTTDCRTGRLNEWTQPRRAADRAARRFLRAARARSLGRMLERRGHAPIEPQHDIHDLRVVHAMANGAHQNAADVAHSRNASGHIPPRFGCRRGYRACRHWGLHCEGVEIATQTSQSVIRIAATHESTGPRARMKATMTESNIDYFALAGSALLCACSAAAAGHRRGLLLAGVGLASAVRAQRTGTLATSGPYVRLAHREEREVAAEFGDAWAAYGAATPRWWPRLGAPSRGDRGYAGGTP